MTVSFGGVVLVEASKTKTEYTVQSKDTVLLSGKHSIQSNANAGKGWTYECLGTDGDVLSLIGMIGAPHTLTIGTTSHTKCYISGNVSVQESDNPNYVTYTVSFVQETC